MQDKIRQEDCLDVLTGKVSPSGKLPDTIAYKASDYPSRGQMMKLVRGKSGLLAHLGTSDAMEVERRIAAGDEKARMVYDAMLYTAAKSIGALAAAADGRIDRIILTGGIAHSRYVTDYLTQKVGFIAPVEVMAGEFEMEALAAGASRVLAGQETPHRFRDLLKGE